MKVNKNIRIIGIIIVFTVFLPINIHITSNTDKYDEESPFIAYGENQDIINQVLDSKLVDYIENGFFSQIYDSSIQAVYYTVEILFKLGKQSLINEDLITSYILSKYNVSS